MLEVLEEKFVEVEEGGMEYSIEYITRQQLDRPVEEDTSATMWSVYIGYTPEDGGWCNIAKKGTTKGCGWTDHSRDEELTKEEVMKEIEYYQSLQYTLFCEDCNREATHAVSFYIDSNYHIYYCCDEHKKKYENCGGTDIVFVSLKKGENK